MGVWGGVVGWGLLGGINYGWSRFGALFGVIWVLENQWSQPLKAAQGLFQWIRTPSTGKYNNTPTCGMLP